MCYDIVIYLEFAFFCKIGGLHARLLFGDGGQRRHQRLQLALERLGRLSISGHRRLATFQTWSGPVVTVVRLQTLLTEYIYMA